MRTSIGGSKMGERTPNPESEETRDSTPESGDAAARSAAEQAKEREREMEESGEENAAESTEALMQHLNRLATGGGVPRRREGTSVILLITPGPSASCATSSALASRLLPARRAALELPSTRRRSLRSGRPGLPVRGAADASALVRRPHPDRLLRHRLPRLRAPARGPLAANLRPALPD